MKKILTLQNIFLILISGFIVGLMVWGLFFVDDTDDKISIISIAGILLAAMASVLTVSFNNKQVKERELELQILNEKMKVYSQFYNYYTSIFKPEEKIKQHYNKPKAPSSPTKAQLENVKLFHEFKKGLINWGSEEIIKEFYKFIDVFEQTDVDHLVILAATENFLRAIRKELNFDVSGDVSFTAITLDRPSRDRLNAYLKKNKEEK